MIADSEGGLRHAPDNLWEKLKLTPEQIETLQALVAEHRQQLTFDFPSPITIANVADNNPLMRAQLHAIFRQIVVALLSVRGLALRAVAVGAAQRDHGQLEEKVEAALKAMEESSEAMDALLKSLDKWSA